MSVELRLPQINATTPREELVQLKSYLYQLVEELNWALNNIEPTAVVHTQTIGSQVVRMDEKTEAESNAALAFGVLKDMIIKSADIVEAYATKIETILQLQETYAAYSDYGAYKASSSAEIQASATNIDLLFQKSESVESNVQGIEDAMRETEAYIRTGLLGEDEQHNLIYGVEVGQTTVTNDPSTFRAFARFTPTRLSFFDAYDNEVAYISNRELHITDAVIDHNLNIGKYTLRTDNGLAFIFMG